MSVEKYSLNLIMLSNMHHLVSNPRNEISRFMTRVANLVKEEWRTVILHDDMTLVRIMIYSQSMKESKLVRIVRNLKRSGSSDQSQPGFQKKVSS